LSTALAVGKRPRGIRVLGDGQHLLVALSGSPIAGPGVDEPKLPPGDRKADGIGLVDLRALKVSRVLRSGTDPEAFALSCQMTITGTVDCRLTIAVSTCGTQSKIDNRNSVNLSFANRRSPMSL
jgi:hypothetical protein